jgi:HEAT repeat protein
MDVRLAPLPMTSNPHLESALEMLLRGDFHSRWDAVKLISDQGEAAIAPLLDLLQSESDWELQWFIVRILGNLQQPSTIPVLVHYLGMTQHDDVAAMAAVALAGFGEVAIAPLVTRLPHASRRLLTVQALAQIRHPQAIAPLLQVARDDDSEVRAVAIEALGHFHDAPEILSVLLTALNDPAAAVRRAAVVGLGFQTDVPVDALQPLLDDPNLDVAQQAAIALGRIGTPATVALLHQALLQVSPPPLQIEIVRALSRVGSDLAMDGIQSYLQSRDLPAVRQEIIAVLGRLENPQTTERATQMLMGMLEQRSLDSSEKRAIAQSLGQLRHPVAMPALIQLLSDRDMGVRFHAIAALKRFEDAHRQLEGMAKTSSGELPDGIAMALREWEWGARSV